jgi:hypothetical protein
MEIYTQMDEYKNSIISMTVFLKMMEMAYPKS